MTHAKKKKKLTCIIVAMDAHLSHVAYVLINLFLLCLNL